MSMFPHTVTVYNVVRTVDMDTLSEVSVNHITVLRGVLLDQIKAANVRQSGLEGADSVTVYIPFDVDATDGVTGDAKRYASPEQFWQAEDKSGLWSLTVTGRGGSTFIVKGAVVEPETDFATMNLTHDDVYAITKVDEKDFGGGMAHWEVGGA